MADFLKDLLAGTALTNLHAHSPDVGGVWNSFSGTFLLDGAGGVYCSANAGGATWDGYVNTVGSSSPDYHIRGVAHTLNLTSAGRIGLALRWQDASNFYGWAYSNGAFYISKTLANAESIISTSPSTFAWDLSAVNDPLVDIGVSGNTFTLQINGVTRLTGTDFSFSSAGAAGIWTNGSAVTIATGVHMKQIEAYVGSPGVGGLLPINLNANMQDLKGGRIG